MDFYKTFIRDIAYPAAMRLGGHTDRLPFYYDCLQKQYRPLEENLEEQRARLYELVKYAVEHVPYYRDWERRQGITFHRETIAEDIKRFPILTKDIIRREGNRMYSSQVTDFMAETSGGSTGEPVRIEQDRAFLECDAQLYFLTFAGYELGDRKLKLWGSERDILEGTIGLKAKISNHFLYRMRFQNSFMMGEEQMLRFVREINRFRPRVILAYVQSAFELAEFIRCRGLKVFSPSGIVVSAGTLFPDWKMRIEEVFGCPVLNQYGSRETSGMAVSCPESGGELHINTFMDYIEVVDDQGQTTPLGEDGNILVTNLINKRMPLIRYQIGDIGALSQRTECPCKRGLPCLKHVRGRVVNVFKKKDGTRVDGEYFTHLFYTVDGVKRFQVIQKEYEKILVNIEMRDGCELTKKDENAIRDGIGRVMGSGCEVKINLCDEIRPSASGKYLYTISQVGQEET